MRDAILPFVGFVGQFGDPSEENGWDIVKEIGIGFNKARVYMKNRMEALNPKP
jgi:hypothetical protein